MNRRHGGKRHGGSDTGRRGRQQGDTALGIDIGRIDASGRWLAQFGQGPVDLKPGLSGMIAWAAARS